MKRVRYLLDAANKSGRAEVEAGDRGLIPKLVVFYLENPFARSAGIPCWLVREFRDAVDKVQGGGATWNEVFRSPVGKRKRRDARRRKTELQPKVYHLVQTLRQQGRSIDDALFEDVGAALGIKKTLVKEYYYAPDGQRAVDENWKRVKEATRTP
jgi:hypothetical protein